MVLVESLEIVHDIVRNITGKISKNDDVGRGR